MHPINLTIFRDPDTILRRMRESLNELHRDWKKPNRTDDDLECFLARLERLTNISVVCESVYGDGPFNQITMDFRQVYQAVEHESLKEVNVH